MYRRSAVMCVHYWHHQTHNNLHTNHCTLPGTSLLISFFTKLEVDIFSYKAMRAGKPQIHVLLTLFTLYLYRLIIHMNIDDEMRNESPKNQVLCVAGNLYSWNSYYKFQMWLEIHLRKIPNPPNLKSKNNNNTEHIEKVPSLIKSSGFYTTLPNSVQWHQWINQWWQLVIPRWSCLYT